MTLPSFEALLDQADAHVRQGDWEAALADLSRAARLQPHHPGALTGLGTCMLQLGRLDDAIGFFRQVAELAPQSPEAHNNLGVAYALNQDFDAAEQAYQKAVTLDGEHVPAWKNLALLFLRQNRLVEGVQILAALVKTNPGDAEALFLLARCYEEGGDAASARSLYEEIVRLQPDHAEARQALSRLLAAGADPARIARAEHARKLAALKGLKREKAPSARPSGNGGSVSRRKAPGSIAFIGPLEAATFNRLGPPAEALAEAGFSVWFGAQPSGREIERFDALVCANPQASPPLLAAIERSLQAGKRVVIDLEQDFFRLPADHPAYAQSGPGNPAALQGLQEALAGAHCATVPCAPLAERLKPLAARLDVVPHSWSRANPLWEKPAPCRQTVNLGLVGRHTRPGDLEILRPGLLRLMRQCPQALLVIAEELALCQAFAELPESRLLFIPPGCTEDYPFLLAQMDILLVPLRDDEYNRARADLPLLEAGLRRIPWVATPVPAFEEWGQGGLFAGEPGEWQAALRRLVEDPARRQELGAAGRQAAEPRQSGQVALAWQRALGVLSPAAGG